jgi:hypothetical protein
LPAQSLLSPEVELLLRLGPLLGLVLTALGIIFNIAKDIYAVQSTPTGVQEISVTTYVYQSERASLARELVTRLSLLVAVNSIAVGASLALYVTGIAISININGRPFEPLAPQNIVGFVLATSLTAFVFGSIVAHLMMVVRQGGPTQN